MVNQNELNLTIISGDVIKLHLHEFILLYMLEPEVHVIFKNESYIIHIYRPKIPVQSN